jgi:uncharacterized protein YqhQ
VRFEYWNEIQGCVGDSQDVLMPKENDLNQRFDANKPMQVGGQAVIEGVMMRAPGTVATAVRRANGEIILKKEEFRSLTDKHKWLGVPVLRGAVGLVEMLILGVKTLNYSAEISLNDLEEDGKDVQARGDGHGESKRQKRSSEMTLILTMIVALAFGLAIFFVLPLYVTTHLFSVEREALSFNLIAGTIRITILVGYLFAISLMKDVKRLFQYHGAEHKSVFAFEFNDELTTVNAKKYTTFHPRCGTSFVLIVMFVAVLLFSFLDSAIIAVFGGINLGTRLIVHLPFIPIVGGIAYEFIKFSARKSSTKLGKIVVAPGLWLQKITTKEPDEKQLEVAIVALRCALGMEYPVQVPIAQAVSAEVTS